jgi:predicted transcriptional regulator
VTRLLDECVPRPLRRALRPVRSGTLVSSVAERARDALRGKIASAQRYDLLLRYPEGEMPFLLPEELESRLTQFAADHGRDASGVAREAIERFLDFEAWFDQQVDIGIRAADSGDLIDHDAVGQMVERRYSSK